MINFPVLSTIPIRSQVIAPTGWLLVNFDLAQAESWIVAYRANEPNIKHALNFGDIHRETAQKAFAKVSDEVWEAYPKYEIKARRYVGKQFNHATSYRMGPKRAMETINKKSDRPPYIVVSLQEAKNYFGQWHSYYYVKGWWDEIDFNLRTTRTITTAYGRKRYFFGPLGEELSKAATAYEPQSTIGDHLNGAIQDINPVPGGVLGVYKKLHAPGYIKIINQSHDSILAEIPRSSAVDICQQIHAELLRPLVINGEEFTIPVDCEVGERWGELVEQKRTGLEIKYNV